MHHNNSVHEYVFNLVVWLWSQIVVVCCCWLSLVVFPGCLSGLTQSMCPSLLSHDKPPVLCWTCEQLTWWQKEKHLTIKESKENGLLTSGGRGERALHSEWTEGFEEAVHACTNKSKTSSELFFSSGYICTTVRCDVLTPSLFHCDVWCLYPLIVPLWCVMPGTPHTVILTRRGWQHWTAQSPVRNMGQ